MNRRRVISLLGAAAWPIAARAQEQKRVAVLAFGVATSPTTSSHLAAFVQGLRCALLFRSVPTEPALFERASGWRPVTWHRNPCTTAPRRGRDRIDAGIPGT